MPSCVRVPRSVAGVLRGRGEAAGGSVQLGALVETAVEPRIIRVGAEAVEEAELHV